METNKKPASDILRAVAAEEKKKLSAKNEYVEDSDEYSVTHPNAISDGDIKGKGGEGKKAGSSLDITERTKMEAKNMFGEESPYKNPEIN